MKNRERTIGYALTTLIDKMQRGEIKTKRAKLIVVRPDGMYEVAVRKLPKRGHFEPPTPTITAWDVETYPWPEAKR